MKLNEQIVEDVISIILEAEGAATCCCCEHSQGCGGNTGGGAV